MAESSGFQGLDKFLKAQLKRGFELGRELETQLNFAQGPDCTTLICNYLDNIVITFSSARGLISLNSSASNFEGTENPIENHFGGIEAGHSQKYVKDNRNSCARSLSRSATGNWSEMSVSRNRFGTEKQKGHEFAESWENEGNWSDLSVSRNRLGTGKQKCHEFAESWENEGNWSDLSVSRNRLGTGKQKCHEFAESWENEGFSNDREQAISRKRNRLGTGKQKCHEFAESQENEGFSKDREPAISRKRRYTPTSTTIVPANSSEPGNDIPPEDGYTWRKYGQNETLGDKHPRMYYKCTYRGCKAKKIVQRPNDNPSVFQVKYSELHSCQRDAQFFKSSFPGSPIKTLCPISAFQGTNANPNAISPTARVFGTDSNLISSNSSIGNVAIQPPTDFLSSSSTPLFAASDGGATLDSFVWSPSNLPNDESSAQREMPLTSHSAADQMHRLQSSEKEASTDLGPQRNEWPSLFLEEELAFPFLDFTSEANYMPTELRSQASGSDIGSSNR